jgi:hypothetical protein
MTALSSFPDDITIQACLDDEWRDMIAIRGTRGRALPEHMTAAIKGGMAK